MRRWLAICIGLLALAAVLRRRRSGPVEVEPADELRARLAESRVAPEPEPAPEIEAEPEAVSDAVGDRRRDLHDRARAAIDELA
jgi:hypothetical protein